MNNPYLDHVEHDYWPHFGHTHIDDEHIWKHLVYKQEKP